MESRTLSFGITGEFITKVAREWFFIESKPYEVVEELLLSGMSGTDIPKGKLQLMAQDILLGRAEFRGNSWDDTYRYVILDNPAEMNLIAEYAKVKRELKREKESRENLSQKYLALLDGLRMWYDGELEDALDSIEDQDAKDIVIDLMALHDQVLLEYYPGYGRKVKFRDSDDEVVIQKTTGEPLLDSFFRQKSFEDQFEDNYGWLEPNGTFHEVPWCDHQEFARKTIENRGWQDEFDRWDDDTSIYCNGDFLTQVKGWALLHNPGRGVAIVTRDESKRLTKAQREFLFDYYAKRKMMDKAKEYLEDC